MTPKEKAEELINSFIVPVTWKMGQEDIKKRAKQCALIAVDEVLRVAFFATDQIYQFYFDVRKEIEKI